KGELPSQQEDHNIILETSQTDPEEFNQKSITDDSRSESESFVMVEDAETEETKEDDMTSFIDEIRQELSTLKAQREEAARQHETEVETLQKVFQAAQEELQHQLYSKRAHLAIYTRFLKHDYYEIEERKAKTEGKYGENPSRNQQQAPESTYVLKQETALLSAVHRTFCIYPAQENITKKYYEGKVYPFFEQELRKVQEDRESIPIEKQVVQEAKGNAALFDAYRHQVEEQETQLRSLRKQLVTSGKLGKEHELLSETQHSHSSTTLDYDHSEASLDESPFVSVKKLLMTPTERLSNSFNNSMHDLKLAVASQKFQLPFGQ
ncbi:MAG: hypothetical protein SGILL_000878, partial [Bacillariaceae sp.]